MIRSLIRSDLHRALLASLVVFSGSVALAADPPRIPDSPFKDLQDRWKDAMSAFGVPGFAVAVVKGDEVILLDAMGIRDAESKKPVSADTMFYIASCTKTFNAMAAVALSEDGKLDLDAPVRKYLPQLELPDAELASTLTIRDLLDHRWGISCEPIVFNDAYTGQITDELYFRLLRNARISKEVEYSNVHFTLLARVIQKITGQDWRDYLNERILKPAGMKRTTGYASKLYADADVALPVYELGSEFRNCPIRKTDRTMHGAGGMGASARDLGRWIQLHLAGGTLDGRKVISPQGIVQMLTSQTKLPKPDGKIRVRQGFGLGWGLGTYRGRPYAFHGGGFPGASASISFLPEDKIGVAIVANSTSGGALADIVSIDIYDRLIGHLGDDLLPRYKERAPEMRKRGSTLPDSPNPAKGDGLSRPASEYAGEYTSTDWGTAVVTLKASELGITIGDLTLTLHTKGADRFVGLTTPEMSYEGRFEIHNDRVAALVLQMDHGDARFDRRLP